MLTYFTFQSGSIQICKPAYIHKVVKLYIPIWFYSNARKVKSFLAKFSLHSNLVLFKCTNVISSLPWLSTLHSNLVLFKFSPPSFYHFLKVFFTFQSGSIQIRQFYTLNSDNLPLHSNLVLFKCSYFARVILCFFLYIPIWFYSNWGFYNSHICDIWLYIPIWFYSNYV